MNRLPISPLIMRGLEIAEKRLGMRILSSRLGATETDILAWRLGHGEMPQHLFLRLVDLLTELDHAWVKREQAALDGIFLEAARPRRILVVDDHPDTADSCSALLKALGHEARSVTDSRLAIKAAGEFRPEVALLDLGMPHIDGCQLARMFRADPTLKNVCLIALTAYDDEKHRLLTREAGFDAHVLKPADQYILRAVLAQIER